MRKIMTVLLAAVLAGSTLAPTMSCASRTPQQKKTKAFKRQSKGGRMPCPTHDCYKTTASFPIIAAMKLDKKAAILIAFLVGAATTATAQRRQPVSLVVPPKTMAVYDPAGKLQGAVGGNPGRYQLPDGTWHETLIYEIKPDRVYLGEAGKGVSTAVFPEQITRFAVNGEVYGAVSGFRLKPGGRMEQPAFARQLFDAGGYTLLAYGEEEESFWVRLFGQRLLLRIGTEPITVLPTRRKPFNRLMLTIVGDNPDLARQLRANKFQAWPDAADILTAYVLAKASSANKSE